MNNLPTSAEAVAALATAGLIAAVTRISVILKDPKLKKMNLREIFGSAMVAIVTAMLAYAILAHTQAELSGWVSVSVGAMSGLFLEEILKRLMKKLDRIFPDEE